MMTQILAIVDYMIESFIQIWPYLLITIPIAVAVQMSGASKYINKALTARPILAIFLATAVGAFSPLCSCSVIPVVAALLIGGVPLAPVMSFWVASPSMDPEIFFLTVSSLGWELAVWRLAATLVLSLGAGFVTHFVIQRGWLGENILREKQVIQAKTIGQVLKENWQIVKKKIASGFSRQYALANSGLVTDSVPCTDVACGTSSSQELPAAPQEEAPKEGEALTFWKRLRTETWKATSMVIKFMMLAWFLGAIIQLYVPEEWIVGALGSDNPWSILTASLLGIPVYTSNMAAMPLVGGLLAQGMHPAAALSFLIAGPTTTLPAMSAVWGLVNRKVFALYIGFSLVGAVVLGYVYNVFLVL